MVNISYLNSVLSCVVSLANANIMCGPRDVETITKLKSVHLTLAQAKICAAFRYFLPHIDSIRSKFTFRNVQSPIAICSLIFHLAFHAFVCAWHELHGGRETKLSFKLQFKIWTVLLTAKQYYFCRAELYEVHVIMFSICYTNVKRRKQRKRDNF